MSCPLEEDVLYERAFGLLENEKKAGVETHLADCSRCRTLAEEFEQRLSCLDEIGEIESSPDLADRILTRVHSAARWRRRLFLVAILALVIVAGFIFRFAFRLAEDQAETGFFRELDHAIQAYRNENGAYPPMDRSLSEFVEIVPERIDPEGRVLDRWNRPIEYTAPGVHNPKLFDLHSFGRNGRDQDGERDDISNW